MKYEIGDKVRIRSDLVANELYGVDMFIEEMIPYRGKEATIEKVIKDRGYHILEDGMEWFWTDEMIEGLAESIKTNLDHYAKNILKYIGLSMCGDMICEECLIHNICDSFVSKEDRSKDFIEWCKEEYKESRNQIKMTLFERSILECAIAHGYEWIARDEIGYLFIYRDKPQKNKSEWNRVLWEYSLEMSLFEDKFQFIKWEDEEPLHIPTALKETEIKGE